MPITILLLSVTDIETEAVVAVFQEQLGQQPAPQYVRDKTYYDLGAAGDARVWLVRSEMGSSGPGGAQMTVVDAIDHLRPSAILMVGIAFGLQPQRQQIGDVLVARQVMSYNLQRIGTDTAGSRTSVPRGDRATTSVRLLDRCRDGALSWRRAGLQPQIHTGLLLSGDKLIDHAPLARQLVQIEPEALGGDMESAGLHAAATPRKVDWIVIKAISDWADGSKAEDQQARQLLAARNAARFALHVIQRGGLGPEQPSQRYGPAPEAPIAAPPAPAHHAGKTDQVRAASLQPPPLSAGETALFGRERETGALAALLRQPDVRAVTITGPGGVGKTSLARQVASELQPSFRNGAAWVGLESVQDAALLWPAVVQALGLTEAADSPAERLVGMTLQTCELLLVLDTFEHLLAATAAVERLLAAAPGVKILITSQIGPPFSTRTYRRFALAPLAVPRDTTGLDLAALTTYPAVALFADCAARTDCSFQLTEENAADVVELCALLNGLPLAIELVSSRVNVYSPSELYQEISKPGRLRANLSASHPPRHQSLQHMFDWSYHLLNPAEQRLIARLAIFPGGFTHDSARVICQSPETPEDIGEMLASLVNKSFVQRSVNPDGSSRFSILKLIRTCASVHQSEGEREQLYQRLSAYVTELVHNVNQHLHKPDQSVWIARLDQEIDNLREVLRWELQNGDVSTMARLAVALEDFWGIRGYLTEGCMWLNEASRHLGRYTPRLQAQLCASLGILLAKQSNYARSRVLFARSLDIWQKLQDFDEIGPAIENFGTIANQQADYAQAQQYYQQALEVYRRTHDLRGMASIVLQQGAVALDSGDLQRAERLLTQALEQHSQLSDTEQIALALTNLGRAVMYSGDLTRSRLLLEESLKLWERLMHRQGRAGALIYLAATARRQGHVDEAAGLCRQSLELFSTLGDQVGIAEALEEEAQLVLGRGAAVRAARLLGAADLLRQRAGVQRPAVERGLYAQLLDGVRLLLPDAAFDEAWESGRLLALRPHTSWTEPL